jgi:hypothetical protein
MPYKTILVHLNVEKMLQPALYLAQRYNAHLIGVHVYPRVLAPPVPECRYRLEAHTSGRQVCFRRAATTYKRTSSN